VSCCQGQSSCRRQIEDWLHRDSQYGLRLCSKHLSHGIFGAIREDNSDLFHFYLTSLTKKQFINLINHETNFGDTLLIFAASLGRVAIARSLLNSFVDSIRFHETNLLLSDLVDYESKRGKVSSTDVSSLLQTVALYADLL
jgi:hypothetical protein